MVELFLMTSELSCDLVLPSLGLLSHTVRLGPCSVDSLIPANSSQLTIVDARNNLMLARGLTQLLHTTGAMGPVVVVVTAGSLVTINNDWKIDDFFLPDIGPAELEARLRLLVDNDKNAGSAVEGDRIVVGDLVIDEESYSARIRGKTLDLTYKEFELLKYLVTNVGRVFTRTQLLQEVWGYDFLGGSRTVDVHVRRLRAKLGNEYEALISTVRNVGYKAVKD